MTACASPDQGQLALILVKHSLPEIIPTIPANEWTLSDEGRRRCKLLAEQLAPYQPHVFVTSTEPKAAQTGEIAARRLGRPHEIMEGLHEHDRRGTPYGDQQQFETAVARLFAQPGELVYGRETADQAHRRFSRAVQWAIEGHPGKSLCIVAHGTVIALFVAHKVGLEPYPLWKRLGLPAFIVISLPQYELVSIVEGV